MPNKEKAILLDINPAKEYCYFQPLSMIGTRYYKISNIQAKRLLTTKVDISPFFGKYYKSSRTVGRQRTM